MQTALCLSTTLTYSFFILLSLCYYLFIVIYTSTLQLSSDTHQKSALDPITDGCEPPCSCWELNSGPLEEQLVLLTTEPSLQPRPTTFTYLICKKYFLRAMLIKQIYSQKLAVVLLTGSKYCNYQFLFLCFNLCVIKWCLIKGQSML